jgi:hypothetical protein
MIEYSTVCQLSYRMDSIRLYSLALIEANLLIIHVKHERRIAKFWLSPVVLAKNRGFAGHELNQIARFVSKHEAKLLEAWNDYFST